MDLEELLDKLNPAPQGTKLRCNPILFVGSTDDYADLTCFRVKKVFRMYPRVSMQEVSRVGFGKEWYLDEDGHSTDILKQFKPIVDFITWEGKEGLCVLLQKKSFPSEAAHRSVALECAWYLYYWNLTNKEIFNYLAALVHDPEWAAHMFGEYTEQMRLWVEMVSLGRWKIAEEARKEWQMSRTCENPKEFREILQRVLRE